MSRNITLAFAGNGTVKKKTVFALLDDFLGFGPVDADGYPEPSEHDLRVIVPASVEHTNDNLQTVIDWTEYADLPYEAVLAKGDRDDSLEQVVKDAEQVHEVANVDNKVIDLLKSAEGEAFLVLLWNDDDPHTEILLDLASSNGVKALDLTEGLDDLSFDDGTEETEAAPEPEPEPEEKPARGRRGSRRAAAEPEEAQDEKPAEKPARGRRRGKEEPLQQSEEQPLTEDDEESTPEPEPTPEAEEPKRRGRSRKAEEPAPATEEVKDAAATEKTTKVPTQDGIVLSVDAAYLSGALQSIFLFLQGLDATNAYRTLGEAEESPVTSLAREALEHVSLSTPAVAEEPEEETKRGRGRPRKTAPEDETTGYLKNADGVYRKAGRGRPKRGEEKVDLTAVEVADLQEQGLILDED